MRSALRLCSSALHRARPARSPSRPRTRRTAISDIRKACLEVAQARPARSARERTRSASWARSRSRPRDAAAANARRSAIRPGSTGRITGAPATRRRKPISPTVLHRLARAHLLDRNTRGIDGALMDLEYQRMELIKFNLFDNRTYETYVKGGHDNGRRRTVRSSRSGRRCALPPNDPNIANGDEERRSDLQRGRPSASAPQRHLQRHQQSRDGLDRQLFARKVQFETTYPDLGLDVLDQEPARRADLAAQARPAGDQPQAVHARSDGCATCNKGKGTGADSNCDYQKAPFFNVIAAYWIQFMTHDWFTHMADARNDRRARRAQHGLRQRAREQCRAADHAAARRPARLPPGDKMEAALFADDAPRRRHLKSGSGKTYMARSPKTTRNSTPPGGTPRRSTATTTARAAACGATRAIPPSCRWCRRTPARAGDAFGYLPEPSTTSRSDPARMGRTGSDRDARTTGRSGSRSCTTCSCASTTSSSTRSARWRRKRR